MNYRLIAIALYLVFASIPSSAQNVEDSTAIPQTPDFSELFKFDYQKALNIYTESALSFDSICNRYGIDTAVAVSIVFPEMIRYSSYKDILETLSLEAVYIRMGSGYANFSIGLMQMKPSFAEEIEEYLKTERQLLIKYRKINRYKPKTEKDIRAERLERLKTNEWQMVYLCAFCDIVSLRYNSAHFNSKESKIMFYAAAYNSDFNAPEKKIRLQIKKRLYPNGINGALPQYPYSLVALDFYRNYLLK